MSESFGAMLRRLRQARTMVAPIQPGNPSSRLVERALSQNELAHRAGVTAGAVHRLEDGAHRPTPETARLLAEALGLEDADACRLLVAAGYWPWPDDPERTERAILAAEQGGWIGGEAG